MGGGDDGGVELFFAVGVGLFTSDAEPDAAGDPGPELGAELGVEVGLELGVPVGDAEPELVGVGLPEGLLLGEAHVGSVGSGDAAPDDADEDEDDAAAAAESA